MIFSLPVSVFVCFSIYLFLCSFVSSLLCFCVSIFRSVCFSVSLLLYFSASRTFCILSDSFKFYRILISKFGRILSTSLRSFRNFLEFSYSRGFFRIVFDPIEISSDSIVFFRIFFEFFRIILYSSRFFSCSFKFSRITSGFFRIILDSRDSFEFFGIL